MTTTTSRFAVPATAQPFTRLSAWLRAALRSLRPRAGARTSGLASEHDLACALAGVDARMLRDLGFERLGERRRRERDALPAEYYRGRM